MNAAPDLRAWIGRTETLRDTIDPTPVAALAATLDHPAAPVPPGTPLPPLWHWLYFLPLHRQSELGPDGHARRGGFLPPVPLPVLGDVVVPVPPVAPPVPVDGVVVPPVSGVAVLGVVDCGVEV